MLTCLRVTTQVVHGVAGRGSRRPSMCYAFPVASVSPSGPGGTASRSGHNCSRRKASTMGAQAPQPVAFRFAMDGFLAQAGDPIGTGTAGPRYQFNDERSALVLTH